MALPLLSIKQLINIPVKKQKETDNYPDYWKIKEISNTP